MRNQRRFFSTILALASLAAPLAAQSATTIDAGESPARWTVSASDGVIASLHSDQGHDGPGLRLDFDFTRGSGFCVVRLPVDIDLSPNYRFSFAIRGTAPRNNLEFKLIDETGDNVWWINRRDYEFPAEWRVLPCRARQMQFAWGPSAGAPLRKVRAIEFAIAAGQGGKGSLCLDSLSYESLAPVTTQPVAARIVASSGMPAAVRDWSPGRNPLNWKPASGDQTPWLTIDRQGVFEIGGVELDWGPGSRPEAVAVETSADGRAWQPLAAVPGSPDGMDIVTFPSTESRHLRLSYKSDRGRRPTLSSLNFLPPEFSESPNALLRYVAKQSHDSAYPTYFRDHNTPWTVLGVPGDENEALFDALGAIESGKRAWRLEPFLLLDGKVFGGADAAARVSLADGDLPIPTVEWSAGPVRLAVTALADGRPGESEVIACYSLRNTSTQRRAGRLALAVRPFQVLPWWQELNLTGGVAPIERIQRLGEDVVVDGRLGVRSWTGFSGFAASRFADGEIVEHLAASKFPTGDSVTDPLRLASAAMLCEFDLEPDASVSFFVTIPLHPATASTPPAEKLSLADASQRFARRCVASLNDWTARLRRVTLELPPSVEWIERTFRTVQAHILINADGPSIQPGSRTYERSWMRDGTISSTALLNTGHVDQARAFLDWYYPFQYDSGKAPCVVDRRGPDPVPEHDSTGQYIHLLFQLYRYTGDRELVSKHWPRVLKGIEYIESLRAQRMTPEFRDGPPEKRAFFGLVPESISHEGYSAKPMHSYWDDLWVLRGLRDAADLARVMNDAAGAERLAKLRDDFRKCLIDSMNAAMKLKGIAFIPGCVELGDFDATSTATGVYPCGEAAHLPQPALKHTFDRYMDFFRNRRDGKSDWKDYTPYEIRVVSALVMMDRAPEAWELLDYFGMDRTPPEWNQWAEVVWRDKAAPKFIGDLPHTWVGAEFLNGIRSMILYEDEDRDALILGAGLPPAWLRDPAGVKASEFPSPYGPLSVEFMPDGDRIRMTIEGPSPTPPGGLIYRCPANLRVSAAQLMDADLEVFEGRDVAIPASDATRVVTLRLQAAPAK